MAKRRRRRTPRFLWKRNVKRELAQWSQELQRVKMREAMSIPQIIELELGELFARAHIRAEHLRPYPGINARSSQGLSGAIPWGAATPHE